MALKGYFIQATFEDGTEVSAYAAYDGTWYYFYTDRRFRFTLTSTGAVDIQQYQPIGSNMAWYDINIITAVSVEQFDPDNAGGGTGPVPEDVYTKEEVNQLIAEAVEEVESQIPDLVARAVQEAIGGLDDRYVRKTGDTMTGQLKLVYGNSTMSVANTGIRVWDTTDQSNLGNETIRVNIGAGYINLFNTAHDYQATVNANNKIMFLARYNSETNTYTYESRMTNTYWVLNAIDNQTQPIYLGYNDNGAFLYVRDPDNSCYTYISNDDMQMRVGSSSRIWIRNTADEGAFIAYDNDGNNTWYQPTQISAWTNGGTRQSLITPGADAISFNKTVQVPSSASFLVSGACRYAGSYINRYGGTLDVQFNDTRQLTFMRGQLGNGARVQLANESGSTVTELIAEGITSSTQFSIRSTNNIAIRSDLVRIQTLDGYTYVYLSESGGTPSIQLGDFSQTTVRPEVNIVAAGMYITTSRLFNLDGGSGRVIIKDTSNQSMPISYNYSQTIVYNLSNASTPSGTVINVYSLGVIDAINDVINMIQDRIGTNFSVSASAGQLAGGGQTRGGGAGRGY